MGAPASPLLGRCIQINLDVGLGKHDRTDVAPLHHNPSALAHLALTPDKHGPNLCQSGHGGGSPVDLGRPDGLRDVDTIDGDRTPIDLDAGAFGQSGDGGLVIERQVVPQRAPSNSSVHRSAVDVAIAKLFGDGAGDGTFARSRRAVDRNDQLSHGGRIVGLEDCRKEVADQVERLQKILSRAGVASRRASERLMLEGRVTVNGATARELGTRADPARDDIRVDGRRLRLSERHLYVLLNKPRGYVTTRADPQGRPTVIDLLGGMPEYVYPVGRLDFDSEGLLLLTNDGDLANRLTHPRHGVARVYEACVLGVPDAHDLGQLARGVRLDGRMTAPAVVRLISTSRARDRATLVVTLYEGRNRQVRRMFDAVGHPVEDLRRVAIGPIEDRRLKTGEWRELNADEVRRLRDTTVQAPRHAVSRAEERRQQPPQNRKRR